MIVYVVERPSLGAVGAMSAEEKFAKTLGGAGG